MPFILLAFGICLPFLFKISKRTDEIRDQASSFAFEIFTSIRIVFAFGAEDRLHARHEVFPQKQKKEFAKGGFLVGWMLSPMFFAQYATFALIYWFGIKQYVHGHISGVGDITVVLFSVVMVVISIARVWAPVLAMTNATSASTEIFATIDEQVPDITGLKDRDVPVRSDIIFEDVKFAYPSRPDIQILNGVNCTFESGKVSAIVGPSGSGKSTIVGLIERWYYLDVKYLPKDEKQLKREHKQEEKRKKREVKEAKEKEKKPNKEVNRKKKDEAGLELRESHDLTVNITTEPKNSGRVLIGNVNIADTDLRWWRSQIGLVQREPFLFNDTISECGLRPLWNRVAREE